ncbi:MULTISPECIES: hypothetical protein [Acinetobacter]|uniref:hypothetical protein n=1 Tax=Acinetobacter TaxID=469 RepID=UPI0011162F59|nr:MULTISPECIES: hypothetical protein [Acinetobacter]MBJ9370739.1 hypothetical protein [Acinetobacter sp. TGL-Y2]TNL52589.1 hypothetical protein EYB59_05135 [Acinetobacter bereziniae]TNL63465.1 hypothetical protein EYY58_02630 [Acinetobacter bereziniae]
MQGVALQASLQANNLFLQEIDLIKRDYILASEFFDRLTIFLIKTPLNKKRPMKFIGRFLK